VVLRCGCLLFDVKVFGAVWCEIEEDGKISIQRDGTSKSYSGQTGNRMMVIIR
jgi:hypothetical protein